MGNPGGQAGGSWLGGSWLGQGSAQRTLEETLLDREERKRGDMGAREGRSWRGSLFPGGKRIRVTNCAGLLKLQETSQNRTLRFKKGIVGHLRCSLATLLHTSTLLPLVRMSFYFCSAPHHCMHSTALM